MGIWVIASSWLLRLQHYENSYVSKAFLHAFISMRNYNRMEFLGHRYSRPSVYSGRWF